MNEIKLGVRGIAEVRVDSSNTAKRVGSGSLEVFATPMMVALMEAAAVNAVAGYLEDGETSVGTKIDVSHISASPVGANITANAEVTGVDGREVTFNVSASDDSGLIGEGIHKRFVVNSEKFQSKADSKIK